MFCVIYRNLKHHITSNKPTSTHFINLHQNPFLKSISNISKSTKNPSFTVDYLVSSCGLSPEKAFSVAKKFNLCSIEKADSVISLFESYGLTKTHITKIISQRPYILSYDPNKYLKPKFELISHLGVSRPDLSKVFTPAFATASLEKVLRPNISILQVHGVPDYNIARMFFRFPRSLCNSNRLKETVEKVEKLGFDPFSPMFYNAVCTMSGISKSCWDKKLMVYREFGWLENDVISAFKKQPEVMTISEKKISRAKEFFLMKLKCKPTDILVWPSLLMYSLDKRTVPRCAVLKILYSNGLIGKKLNLGTVLKSSERDFLKKFVTLYQETFPEVMKAYKGEIEFEGFGDVVEVKGFNIEPVIDHIHPS